MRNNEKKNVYWHSKIKRHTALSISKWKKFSRSHTDASAQKPTKIPTARIVKEKRHNNLPSRVRHFEYQFKIIKFDYERYRETKTIAKMNGKKKANQNRTDFNIIITRH